MTSAVRCVLCAWRHRKAFRLAWGKIFRCVLGSVNEKKMRIRAVAAAARRKRTDKKNKNAYKAIFQFALRFFLPSHSFLLFPLSFFVCLSSCRVAIYTREHNSRCLRTLSCIYDENTFFFWLVCAPSWLFQSNAIKRCMPNNIYYSNLHCSTSTKQWLRGANCSNSQRDDGVEPEPDRQNK